VHPESLDKYITDKQNLPLQAALGLHFWAKIFLASAFTIRTLGHFNEIFKMFRLYLKSFRVRVKIFFKTSGKS
jgi:hypothetical protein